MHRLRVKDWIRLGCVLVVVALVLGIEVASGRVSGFYVDHPLQAGMLTGAMLSVIALFGVDAIRADLNERRWQPLRRLALLSLAAQTTLLVDVAIWLATAQRPVNDARPDDRTQDELERLRRDAGLRPPPDRPDLGGIRYEDYVAMIRTAADDPAWREFANNQFDHWKWRNRSGIAQWAAAMLTTGETSDVLNRLALLNEWLSDVQHSLRPGSHVDGATTAGIWLRWHAEAVSLREDLVRAARGGLPPEWERFRLALPEADRRALAERAQARDTRHLLAVPLRTRDDEAVPRSSGRVAVNAGR